MRNKEKKLILSILKLVVLAIYLIVVMFPFVWMLLTSLKGTQGEIYAFPVKYLPEKVSFINYTDILWKGNFITYIRNSLLTSTVAATIASIIGICADM